MSGTSLPATQADRCTDKRAQPQFASFAAGVRELALERMTALHTGVLIATFRSAPSACGAFADERRIVAGDEGARV
jgi:hypothetical protein